MTVGRARTVDGIPVGAGAPAVSQTSGDVLMSRLIEQNSPALSWIIDPRNYAAVSPYTLSGRVRGYGVDFNTTSTTISKTSAVSVFNGFSGFTGTGGSIRLGGNLPLPSASFTIAGSAVIPAGGFPTTSATRILSILDSSNSEIFNISIGSTNIYAGNTSGLASRPISGNLVGGKRFDFVVTYWYTEKESKLYINNSTNVGTNVGTSLENYTTKTNKLFILGTGPIYSSTGFNGSVGKIFAFRGIMTESEVASIFAAIRNDYGDA